MNFVDLESLHDRIALRVLKTIKRNRTRFTRGNDSAFYESFFLERNMDQYTYDLRHQLRRAEILKVLTPLPNRTRVLDVGCGLGHVLRALPDRFERVGLDLSQNTLDMAQQMSSDIEFNRGSCLGIPFGDESFDVVICLEVLEHIRHDDRAIREIARVLNGDGLFIVSVPNTHYVPEFLNLMGHFRHYTRAELVSKVARADLKVDRYLNHFSGFHRVHYYPHLLLSLANAALTRITGKRMSIYRRKLPLIEKGLYEVCVPFLERFADYRSPEELAEDPRSTFLVARKTCD